MLAVFSRMNMVKRQLRSLAALTLELAKLEEKQKATALGIAGGLAAGVAALVVYGIGFAFDVAACT